MGKGGKQKSTDFCELFFSMDPTPLNQNDAFCEVGFYFSPFIAKAFRGSKSVIAEFPPQSQEE